MVDPERLSRLIARVRTDVAALRRLSGDLRGSGEADSPTLDAAKYRFVTAIEGCARIAQHIIAWKAGVGRMTTQMPSGCWPPEVLHPPRWPSASHERSVSGMSSHQYVDVDDAAVVGALDRLDDLDNYVESVASWATQR